MLIQSDFIRPLVPDVPLLPPEWRLFWLVHLVRVRLSRFGKAEGAKVRQSRSASRWRNVQRENFRNFFMWPGRVLHQLPTQFHFYYVWHVPNDLPVAQQCDWLRVLLIWLWMRFRLVLDIFENLEFKFSISGFGVVISDWNSNFGDGNREWNCNKGWTINYFE